MSVAAEMSICELPKAGLNLLVSGCDAFENCNVSQSWSAQLPALPPSTQQQLRFAPAGAPASNASFITFGALLSLAPIGSAYYGYSRGMKGSLELFERLVQERGGLLVNGTRRPFRFAIVSDESRLDLTTNATAHAIRGLGADFMLGGFSSGFTNYAARQCGPALRPIPFPLLLLAPPLLLRTALSSSGRTPTTPSCSPPPPQRRR